LAALDWIFKTYKNPRKVLICGESAGAFGSAFWAPLIACHYKDSELYLYSDGSFLQSDQWPDIVDTVWKVNWKETFGYSIGQDPIQSAFINNYKMLGDKITFLHSNTLYDGVLASVQADINRKKKNGDQYIKDWSREMIESTKAIQSAVPSYYYYITDYGYNENDHTTPHTMSPFGLYYKAEEEGVKLHQWLEDVILKGKRYSVGATYLNKSGRI
jgi:hypothetical protein